MVCEAGARLGGQDISRMLDGFYKSMLLGGCTSMLGFSTVASRFSLRAFKPCSRCTDNGQQQIAWRAFLGRNVAGWLMASIFMLGNCVVVAAEPVQVPKYDYSEAHVPRWTLLGPFPEEFEFSREDAIASLKTGEPVLCEDRELEWKVVEVDQFGKLPMREICYRVSGSADHVFFYAACIFRPKNTEPRDYFSGVDDGATVWIDDEEIFHSEGPAWYSWKARRKKLQLEAGKDHLCLAQIRNATGSYAFSLSCGKTVDGETCYFNGRTPLAGVEISVNVDGKQLFNSVSGSTGEIRFSPVPYEAELEFESSSGDLETQRLVRTDGTEYWVFKTEQPVAITQHEIVSGQVNTQSAVTAIARLRDGRVLFSTAGSDQLFCSRGSFVEPVDGTVELGTIRQLLPVDEKTLLGVTQHALFLWRNRVLAVHEFADGPQAVLDGEGRVIDSVCLDDNDQVWATTTPAHVRGNFSGENEKIAFQLTHLSANLELIDEYSLPARGVATTSHSGSVVVSDSAGALYRITPGEQGLKNCPPADDFSSQLVTLDDGRVCLVSGNCVFFSIADQSNVIERWEGVRFPGAARLPDSRVVQSEDGSIWAVHNSLLFRLERNAWRRIGDSEKLECIVAGEGGAVLCGAADGSIIEFCPPSFRRIGIEHGLPKASVRRVVVGEDGVAAYDGLTRDYGRIGASGRVQTDRQFAGIPWPRSNGDLVIIPNLAAFFEMRAISSDPIIYRRADGATFAIPQPNTSGSVMSVAETESGRFLLATLDGIFEISDELELLTVADSIRVEGVEQPTPGAFVATCLQPSGNYVWGGGLLGSLAKLDLSSNTLTHVADVAPTQITSILEMSPDELLVGTAEGMFLYHVDKGHAQRLSDEIVGRCYIQEMLACDDGSVYIAARDSGIFRYYQNVVVPIEGVAPLTGADIWDIELAKNGTLIVATARGVVEYSTQQRDLNAWFTGFEAGGAPISSAQLSAVEVGQTLRVSVSNDASGRMGVWRFRTNSGPWNYLSSSKRNFDVAMDEVGQHRIEIQAVDRDHNFSPVKTVIASAYLPWYRWLSVRIAAACIAVAGVGLVLASRVKASRAQTLRAEAEKLARERAEENVAERERLLHRVSHDLRNPLFVIAGCTEMMEQGHMQVDAALPILNETVESMTYLARQLLSYSRAKAGRYEADTNATDVRALLKSLRDETHISSRTQHVDIRLEVDGNCPAFVKAPNQILKEIVHNLVSNSLKNTVAGEITLGYRCNDGCPQLFVADTGCGMDQEAIDCLFKPFFKQTSTNRASGFGLGLSICKTLADELEAELSVSSGVGAGTVVTLTLPRNSVCGSQSIDSLAISGSGAAVTRDSDSKVAYKERSIDLNNVDGLLIDDLRFVRDVLLRRLDAIGLSVFDCKSTSIPDLTRLAPKFVLTDLEMPVLSGFDIAHRIKESHPGIVVIAISERDDLLDRARECPDFDIVMTKVSLLTNDDEALRVFESFATRPHEPV